MVPVPQDIRKKCSISSLTHVGQRCLTGRQESIFLGFIDYRLQSLLVRYINKAPPDRRSVQNTTDQDGIWHIPEGATTQPVGSQHTKRVECLGTAANNFVNVRFEWKAFMNCDSKNHQLIYPLIPGIGGGGKLALFDLGLKIMISVDFLVLRVKLLAAAQSAIDLSSSSIVCESDAGTMR